MGKVRMLDPSSGHDNFDVVSNDQPTANTTTRDEQSQATNSNKSIAQTVDKKEVEEKTKAAIQAAIASQPQTSPNTTSSDK